MTTTTATAIPPSSLPAKLAQIEVDETGVQLRTIDDFYRYAKIIANSGCAPRGLDTPEKVMIAMQTGMEAGLTKMRAIHSVVVINGLPSWKGESALGLIRRSGLCLSGPDAFLRGKDDQREGVFKFHRKGSEPTEVVFTVADAKRAGLWGKAGPWTNYTEDMLVWRAVGRGSKRYFSDVLMGIAVAEEVQDYPPQRLEAVGASEPPAASAPDPLLADDPPTTLAAAAGATPPAGATPVAEPPMERVEVTRRPSGPPAGNDEPGLTDAEIDAQVAKLF